jgi:hypothetical protein
VKLFVSSQISFGVNVLYWGPNANLAKERLESNLVIKDFPSRLDLSPSKKIWIRSLASIAESPTAPLSSLHALKSKFGKGTQWLLFLGERGLTDPFGESWTLENWHAYAARAVRENPEVRLWEVWNELAGRDRWTGYLRATGVKGYFEMLKDAHATIKSQNPDNVVLCFGGLPTFVASDLDVSLYNEGRWTETPEYHLVRDLWSLGASEYCDGISVHLYGSPHKYLFSDFPESVQASKRKSKLTLKQICDGTIRSYYELCKKPVYFTETGLPSNQSLEMQSEFLRQSFAYASSLPFSRCVLWWNLAGVSQNGLDFSLYNRDGSPKPALSAFSEFCSSN